MSDGKSKVQVGKNGELTNNSAIMVKTIKNKFLKSNNEIASIVQAEVNLTDKLNQLKFKKKELTAKIDKEIKDSKDEMKNLTERRIYALGERQARIKDMEELGHAIGKVKEKEPQHEFNTSELLTV